LRNYVVVLVGFLACQILLVAILDSDLLRREIDGAGDFAEKVKEFNLNLL